MHDIYISSIPTKSSHTNEELRKYLPFWPGIEKLRQAKITLI